MDLPPAISESHRQLLLTQLVLKLGDERAARPRSPAQAARLAAELARLLDQVQTERLPFEALATLVPEEFARHWQITLDFLGVLTEHWPAILAEEGCLDPVERRNRLVDLEIESWVHRPPVDPVIAAGSTGTVPATADLLVAVAGLDQGRVVLPGLDRTIDPESLGVLTATHPQYGMARLLDRLGLAPAEIEDWPAPEISSTLPARANLINEAMRPAVLTGRPQSLAPPPAAALAGISRIECAGLHEEAGAIALVMRGVLEDETGTAALVTPDRALARRVAAELRRWGIEIDDSAGRPLADTPPGVFLRLVAEMVAGAMARALPLLAALKHPLAAGGLAASDFRAKARALELACLRGPRPGEGFAGIRAVLKRRGETADLCLWVDGLQEIMDSLTTLAGRCEVALKTILEAHVRAAEGLAESDGKTGAARLWLGDAGKAAASFVNELRATSGGFSPIAGADYPAFFEALMADRVVRPTYGIHPRLHIWGPLEARLQHAEVMILGGLNEGTWPPEPPADPWLSRPMRSNLGLPPPERRIGLAAHDFVQAFSAPLLVLTRAGRVEGTPTVSSRWLLRLDNVLRAAGRDSAIEDMAARGHQWLIWQNELDKPDSIAGTDPPTPRPPVEARPRRLSVTEVETLRRDPYAVYARHVLGLRPLEPIDADPGAAERGTIVHRALEAFIDAYPGALPEDAHAHLIEIGRKAFGETLERPGVRAFWWPRFERLAAWIVETEHARRTRLESIRNETVGRLEIAAPAGPFTLIAKADRIECLKDGDVSVIDYKTGSVPSQKDIALGFAPQLPLEAAIAQAGGFAGIPAAAVAELAFWQLSGGDPPGKQTAVKGDLAALIAGARDGLAKLIAAYDDSSTPYPSRPDPDRGPRFSDYDHLARVQEYSAFGGED